MHEKAFINKEGNFRIPIKVVKVECVNSGFPNEWFGELEGGGRIYVRERSGAFHVMIGDTISDAMAARYKFGTSKSNGSGKYVMGMDVDDIGEEWQCRYEDMVKITKNVIIWPDSESRSNDLLIEHNLEHLG